MRIPANPATLPGKVEENPLLIPFLNRNLDELAVRLRLRHVIEKLPAEIPQLAALPL